MKTTILPLNKRSPLRTFLLIPFVLPCLALSPQAGATCQEGCLTNANTVLGDNALISLTAGFRNTAVGSNALNYNTTGNQNTAIGWYALFYNTTGENNTATGYAAMFNNTTGVNNTGTGGGALGANTTGSGNTATGHGALPSSTTGDGNTATGVSALFLNTTGQYNTANGGAALSSNTTGSRNIALGVHAGIRLTTESDNIDIGNSGRSGESNTIRIGTTGTQTNAYIAGISGATVASGVGVIVGSNGQLGTVVSSERFKEAVKPMDKASEAILALKPVTFRYKHDLDPNGIPQFGLVAEEVEKVNPDLVARDEKGKPYTVRYEAVNAMLLNEFLKEHRKNEVQENKITQLEKEVEALNAGLQKVSAQLELSKSAPQTVFNGQSGFQNKSSYPSVRSYP